MEQISLRSKILPAPFAECDQNYVNPVQTIEVDVSDGESIKSAIEESKRIGKPILIDGGKISVASAIYVAGSLLKSIPMLPIIDKRAIPIVNPEVAMETKSKVQREKEKNRDLQFKELDAANIPEATKKLIAAEYMRLRTKHKDWKAHRLMRKAGEKYNVKFEFE